jgi:hypothetical protein
LRPVPRGVGDRGSQIDEALPGARLRDLDAFQLRVRPQDGYFDRERGGRIVRTLTPERLQGLGFGEQRLALQSAESSQFVAAAHARGQNLLHEIVTEARTGPRGLGEPAGQLFPAEFSDLVHGTVWTRSCLGLNPRCDQAVSFHFMNYFINVTSI